MSRLLKRIGVYSSVVAGVFGIAGIGINLYDKIKIEYIEHPLYVSNESSLRIFVPYSCFLR